MTRRHLKEFGAIVGGSYLAGMIGAFLVWNSLYSIGSSVVSDDQFSRLHDPVVFRGSIAGLAIGIVVCAAFPHRKERVFSLITIHGFSAIIGGLGANFGWRQALWSYFGTLAILTACVILYTLFRLILRRTRSRRDAD